MADRPPAARRPNHGALAWLRAQSQPSTSSAAVTTAPTTSTTASSPPPPTQHQHQQQRSHETASTSYKACLVCKLNVSTSSFAQHVSYQASHHERLTSFVERQKRRCLVLYSLMTLEAPLHKHCVPRISTLLELLAQRRNAATTAEKASTVEAFLKSHDAESGAHGDSCSGGDANENDQWERVLYATILAGQPMWCRFCETLLPNSDSLFLGYKVFEHYAGQRHETKVASFVNVYKQPQQLKRKLRFTKGSFDKYVERCKAFVPPPPSIRGVGAAAAVEGLASYGLAMLDCAPMPVRAPAATATDSTCTSTTSSSSREVGVAAFPPTTREAVMPHAGPFDNRVASMVPTEEAPGPQVLRTASGIVQCSTGWVDGRRVWGGGIIKVPQAAWIPWPVDLDHDEIGYQSAIMGSAPIASSFTGRRVAASSTATATGSENDHVGGFALGAVGAGLTSIGAHTFRPGEHNIHSNDAPAPWSSVSKDYDWSNVSDTVKAAVAHSNAAFGKPKKTMPKRLGASGAAKPTLLPNFGSVWESGPRSQTRRMFLHPSSPS